MIKLVGLVGSNAKHSYNRMLLQWIKKNYQQQFHLEIIELASFPLFSQNKKQVLTQSFKKSAKNTVSRWCSYCLS